MDTLPAHRPKYGRAPIPAAIRRSRVSGRSPNLSSEASGGTLRHGSVIPQKEGKSVDNPMDRHRNVTDAMAEARNA